MILNSLKKIQSITVKLLIFFLVEVEFTSSILSKNIAVTCALKDRFIEEQVMENDSSREDIADGFALERHVLDVDDLRGNEARSPTSDKDVFFLIGMGSKSKVTDGNFQWIFASEHDIFRFQISVNDPSGGQVVDAIK